jgi:hypothetical protein
MRSFRVAGKRAVHTGPLEPHLDLNTSGPFPPELRHFTSGRGIRGIMRRGVAFCASVVP